MKAKVARTNAGRQKSTSEAVLTQLQDTHALPGIILQYRQLQKLKSTYVDGMLSCVQEGSLYTHWDQTSAATGRLTSTNPNVQAIPKQTITLSNVEQNFIVGKDDKEVVINVRDPFTSKPGHSFLAADFQQIELRLLAHLSGDPRLHAVFSEPGSVDIFIQLTAQWLGKDVKDIRSADREQTKRVVYSVMYGVGKERLADYLKIKPDDAKAIMQSFLVRFPGVNTFTQSCIEQARKQGYQTTIFKRRRLFPNIKNPDFRLRTYAERQAVNFCVQGSAADLCKAAMIQLQQALARQLQLQAQLLVQIHDELLLQVPDENLQALSGLVKKVMESHGSLCAGFVKLTVPLQVSLSAGKTWGTMTEYKVEES